MHNAFCENSTSSISGAFKALLGIVKDYEIPVITGGFKLQSPCVHISCITHCTIKGIGGLVSPNKVSYGFEVAVLT